MPSSALHSCIIAYSSISDPRTTSMALSHAKTKCWGHPIKQSSGRHTYQRDIVVVVSHGSTAFQRDPEVLCRYVSCSVVLAAQVGTNVHQPKIRHHEKARRQAVQKLLHSGFAASLVLLQLVFSCPLSSVSAPLFSTGTSLDLNPNKI